MHLHDKHADATESEQLRALQVEDDAAVLGVDVLNVVVLAGGGGSEPQRRPGQPQGASTG